MALGALKHRDFRLFWLGAFVSFLGTWIQNVGQQFLVFDLTGRNDALGLVAFLGMAPTFFITPIGGWLADRCNKRVVLVLTQSVFAISALVISLGIYGGWTSYHLILALAAVNGVAAAIDMPVRLSMISDIVPPEELGNAIPLNSATFNVARVVGPSVGGLLLSWFGPGLCYMLNSLSYLGIISAVLLIRANLKSVGDKSAPMLETLLGGAQYVLRNPAFRVLVPMVAISAVFGMFYISQIASVAEHIGAGKQGIGFMFTATGVGSLTGVTLLTILSRYPYRGYILLFSMVGFGASLIAFSFANSLWTALPALAGVGLFGITQMVGTNSTLQEQSPPELRGRVIAVHIWSFAGLAPFGALGFGYVCQHWGLRTALVIGGSVVLTAGLAALVFAKAVHGLRAVAQPDLILFETSSPEDQKAG